MHKNSAHHDDNLLHPAIFSDSTDARRSEHLSGTKPFLQQLSLRTKVALFAVAISALPLLATVIIQSWQSHQINEARQHNLPIEENTRLSAQPLLLTYLTSAGLSAILAGGMAVFLTNRVLGPVLQISGAVRKLGQGRLETRLAVQGKDELAVLSANINWMAGQFQSRLHQQATGAQQIHLLKHVTLHLAQFQQVDEGLQSAVQTIRQVFQFDRVLIYKIDQAGVSTLIAASAALEWISVMDSPAELWLQSMIEQPQGYVEFISDVAEADLPEQYLKQLASLSIKASLTAPIVIQNQLLGILIAHQCQDPYVWQTSEVDAWSQLAMQIGLAWERTRYEARLTQLVSHVEVAAQEHRHQQELLQTRLTELLKDFERVAGGDLTVRTTVTREDKSEIATSADDLSPAEACGVIAHVFNATLENLHEIVTQVKQATVQLSAVAIADGLSICQLSEISIRSTGTLIRLQSTTENLMLSLQAIVTQICQASKDVQVTLDTAETHTHMINRTGNSFLRWQEIMAGTIAQVNQFGHNHQKMTRMTILVDQMLSQINTLALNVSLKAAHVEGSAQSFALIAAQMTELAKLSNGLRNAIHEVEQFTLNFQQEASKVVKGIEHGVSLISLGKDFGEMPDQHVEQQARLSQVKQMMGSIARTAELQPDTAQNLLNLVQQLALDSKDVSSETAQVARSHQQVTVIAKQLQSLIQSFKIRE